MSKLKLNTTVYSPEYKYQILIEHIISGTLPPLYRELGKIAIYKGNIDLQIENKILAFPVGEVIIQDITNEIIKKNKE